MGQRYGWQKNARQYKFRGIIKVGGNLKESPGKVVEMLWSRDEKRGRLYRKHGDEKRKRGAQKSR